MPRARDLTDLELRNLPVKDTVYLYTDNGLGIRVFPSGAKTFVFWYRDGDKKRMLTLGNYGKDGKGPGEMPLATARDELKKAQTQRTNGTDPATAKRAEREKERRAARGFVIEPGQHTVRTAFAEWRATDLQPRVERNGKRHGRKDGGALLALQFNKHVFPIIGDMPVRLVGSRDVMSVIGPPKAAGAYRTASVLLASLRQMFDWCLPYEYITANPTRAIPKRKTVGSPTRRKRVLDDAELKAFVQKIGAVDLHVVTVLALRFVLASGQRPGEVAGMHKAELDKAGKRWTIPAKRYKTGVEHMVPLSDYLRRILGEAEKYNAGSDYVFPSPTTDERPIDRHSLSRAVNRKLVALGIATDKPFTPHDLRRTCRTRLAALGVPDEVAERVLGHKRESDDASGGDYNQHAYLDERRAALDLWGKALQKLTPRA